MDSKNWEENVDVLPFKEQFRQPFIDFNTSWIQRYFGALEPQDYEEFDKIDEYIDQGGNIFTAVEGDEPLAVCMVIPRGSGLWEICKLGSSDTVPHKHAGTAVFTACFAWALDHGAERIYIISNTRLEAALHIYRKFGFREVSADGCGFDRGDIAFEYVLPPVIDGTGTEDTPLRDAGKENM